jgi:hypothetical protein
MSLRSEVARAIAGNGKRGHHATVCTVIRVEGVHLLGGFKLPATDWRSTGSQVQRASTVKGIVRPVAIATTNNRIRIRVVSLTKGRFIRPAIKRITGWEGRDIIGDRTMKKASHATKGICIRIKFILPAIRRGARPARRDITINGGMIVVTNIRHYTTMAASFLRGIEPFTIGAFPYHFPSNLRNS